MKARFQEGTREAVFEVLEGWEEEHTERPADRIRARPICVLVGHAGTGKSTIASEFSKRLQERGRLGATFFFTRGVQDLNSPRKFFSTIATQLAHSQPELRTPIVDAAREHLNIAVLQQLERQFEDLLLKPLATLPASHPPIFLVVDALDECTEEGPELVPVLLQRLLAYAACPNCPLRVFLTLRPEPHYIHKVFATAELEPHVAIVSLQDFRTNIDRDIELFIRTRFNADETSKQWSEARPSVIDTLVESSDGLFIYARTVVDFILDDLSDLEHRYLLVASTLLSLDELYNTVVENVLSPQERRFPDMQERLKRILGYLAVIQDPEGISPTTLQNLTRMSTSDSVPILNKLRSVIFFERDNANSKFRIIHATFRDFLTDQRRLGSVFHVNVGQVHGKLAKDCTVLLNSFRTVHWQDIAGASLILRLLTDPRPPTNGIPSELLYAAEYLEHHYKHQCYAVPDESISPDGFPAATLLHAHFEHKRRKLPTTIWTLLNIVFLRLREQRRCALIDILRNVNAKPSTSPLVRVCFTIILRAILYMCLLAFIHQFISPRKSYEDRILQLYLAAITTDIQAAMQTVISTDAPRATLASSK